MTWLKLLALAVTIGFSVAGSYGFKRAADEPDLAVMYFALGMAAWTVSAIGFMTLLKTGPLGLWGPFAAVVQMGIVMLIGAAFLNESFTAPQWALAGISMAAMGLTLALQA